MDPVDPVDRAPESAPLRDDDDGTSRRVFVQSLAFGAGGVVLLGAGCREQQAPPPVTRAPAAPAPAPLTTSHRTFTNEEFATLSAAVDRVVPRDADPGALDANVPEYIDRILQTPQLHKMREDFTPGLAAIERRCQRMHKTSFASATPAQRDELLALFKDSAENSGEARWYEILVVLTLEGFLGDPSYGGNRGEVGWKLLGFTLVGRNPNARGDPPAGYDGLKQLESLRCGGGKGC